MRRILIVKLTSLGDVLFALPIVADIRRQFPQASIDWLVDDCFAALPEMNVFLDRIISVPLRGRRQRSKSETLARIWASLKSLRAEKYDLVLDCHGMIKSALCSRLAIADEIIGPPDYRLGEQASHLAYRRQIDVPANLAAIGWYRAFAGLALGYEVSGLPDFGLNIQAERPGWLPDAPYVVCFHAASKPEKAWPHWAQLVHLLVAQGLVAVLPWGSARELLQAQDLAADNPGAIIAPRLSIGEIAGVISNAEAAIGVDTGLMHLAESIEAKSIALYTSTNPATYHPYWCKQALSLGNVGVVPSVSEVLSGLRGLAVV